MKRNLFLLIVLLYFNNVNAQDSTRFNDGNTGLQNSQNPTIPFGVAAGISFVQDLDFMATISIDYFFTKRISAGFTYGIFLRDTREKTYSIGVQFGDIEGISQSGLSPFVGLNFVYFGLLDAEPGLEDNTFIWEKDYFYLLEVPLGIRYTTKFGLQTSLQLSYYFYGFSFDDFHGPNVELRVGWRFNLRKGKEATPK